MKIFKILKIRHLYNLESENQYWESLCDNCVICKNSVCIRIKSADSWSLESVKKEYSKVVSPDNDKTLHDPYLEWEQYIKRVIQSKRISGDTKQLERFKRFIVNRKSFSELLYETAMAIISGICVSAIWYIVDMVLRSTAFIDSIIGSIAMIFIMLVAFLFLFQFASENKKEILMYEDILEHVRTRCEEIEKQVIKNIG